MLDVGGGAGLILKEVSKYIEDSHNVHVNIYALDLSPGMLAVQKRNNPTARLLNEDISRTSLGDKEIDIVLMIDVLEHIYNPAKALKELERISRFVIFKIPLEDNIISNTSNFIRRGRSRQIAVEAIGHINVYNLIKLKHQIEVNGGQVLSYYLTNVFDYYLTDKHYVLQMNSKNKLKNHIASYIFKASPNICSHLFEDFVMVLVKYT